MGSLAACFVLELRSAVTRTFAVHTRHKEADVRECNTKSIVVHEYVMCVFGKRTSRFSVCLVPARASCNLALACPRIMIYNVPLPPIADHWILQCSPVF